MPTVFSANSSSILVNGDPVEGLQSLAFRVVTEREDIRAVGSDERIDVSFGLRTVLGELVVLGHGKLKKALTIQAHRVTPGAREAIEKAGGTIKLLNL